MYSISKKVTHSQDSSQELWHHESLLETSASYGASIDCPQVLYHSPFRTPKRA